MAEINTIKEMYFEKGLSYAEIARTTCNDVKTVRKYLLKRLHMAKGGYFY